MDSSLPRTTPEAQGIPSATIHAFIESAEAQIHELHSFMLVRHGAVVGEGWWSPYRADAPHILYSLSKSFTSSAIGLLVMDGKLSVEDKLIDLFPDDLPATVSDNLAAMRVHDLLSMSTGHETEPDVRTNRNWVKGFLAHPVVYQPGTHFLYNSIATYMQSAIVQKITGTRLLDFLQPRLLEPLGITGATWELSPQGINTGGWGLKIKTEDIARFGQMYLQKGVWNGKRILSEDWIARATSKQIDNGNDPNSDWAQGYGYQFWRCRHGAYRGDGAFGQYCIVMPEQDVVLAITSGVSDMQQVMNLIWDCLLPAMGDAPLPENAVDYGALAQKQASLKLLPPAGDAAPTVIVSDKPYRAESNPIGLERVAFDFSAAQPVITLTLPEGEQRLVCGAGEWQPAAAPPFNFTQPPFLMLYPEPIVASGVWTAGDTFTVTVRMVQTPFYLTLTFRFSAKQVTLDVDRNVAFIPDRYSIVARRA